MRCHYTRDKPLNIRNIQFNLGIDCVFVKDMTVVKKINYRFNDAEAKKCRTNTEERDHVGTMD